ncbi:MAG: XamI family restriction endonuclease [Thermoleophilia bacterium]
MTSGRFRRPPVWDAHELDAEIAAAKRLFTAERLDEPLQHYQRLLERYMGDVEDLIEQTVDLSLLREHAVEVTSDPRLLRALRFCAGPPVSEDDLKVLTGISLAPGRLRASPSSAGMVIDVIRLVLDDVRFPWAAARTEPSEGERAAAVLATAALMATEGARTRRRNTARTIQEEAVADALLAAGFRRTRAPRKIEMLQDAPGPGVFCDETAFGERQADLIVGLWDGRRMPIECKVSNSTVNSVKRVNNDAAAKAESWLQDFGRSQVVPCAVLSGVFKRTNLESAQSRGLTLFWAHRLDDLTGWIAGTAAA